MDVTAAAPPRPVGPWLVGTFQYPAGGDDGLGLPPPPAGTGKTLFVLGADGPLGRDELLRLLYGGRVSLVVGVGATLFALAIGVVLGVLAGWLGGIVDGVSSRFTDLVMAFPYLLFLVMIGSWRSRSRWPRSRRTRSSSACCCSSSPATAGTSRRRRATARCSGATPPPAAAGRSTGRRTSRCRGSRSRSSSSRSTCGWRGRACWRCSRSRTSARRARRAHPSCASSAATPCGTRSPRS